MRLIGGIDFFHSFLDAVHENILSPAIVHCMESEPTVESDCEERFNYWFPIVFHGSKILV
jgi:hypothetical protein